MQGKTIGFALTGSFCTLAQILPMMQNLVNKGANVVPIISRAVAETDTRFGKAQDFIEQITAITGKKPIDTIPDAEPIGPKAMLDALLVAPCTGNTLAKLANGITDTPVTMACKAHLRNLKPLVLAISTNDALSNNARNIGQLLNMRHVYFVPFGQDDPQKKRASLIADFDKIEETLEMALQGNQIQPIIITGKHGG